MKVAMSKAASAVLSSAWISYASQVGVGERMFIEAVVACGVPARTKIRGRFGIVRRTP
jgi:hypothetical protein